MPKHQIPDKGLVLKGPGAGLVRGSNNRELAEAEAERDLSPAALTPDDALTPTSDCLMWVYDRHFMEVYSMDTGRCANVACVFLPRGQNLDTALDELINAYRELHEIKREDLAGYNNLRADNGLPPVEAER